MRDCENGAIRDLLPDLVHARLDALERARVERHVAACADCAAEAALIARASTVLARATPRIDTARIASAFASPPREARRSYDVSRALRIAAGALIVVLGGALFARGREGDTQRQAAAVAQRADSPVGVTIVGGIDQLTTQELETLVAGIASLEAAPATEPDPLQLTSLEVGEVQ